MPAEPLATDPALIEAVRLKHHAWFNPCVHDEEQT